MLIPAAVRNLYGPNIDPSQIVNITPAEDQISV